MKIIRKLLVLASIPIAVFTLFCLGLYKLSVSRVDDIKEHAEQTLGNAGFKIIGYEGYQGGLLDGYGGCVWYIAEKKESAEVTYDCALTKWGSEYHIYHLKAMDAVRPH